MAIDVRLVRFWWDRYQKDKITIEKKEKSGKHRGTSDR